MTHKEEYEALLEKFLKISCQDERDVRGILDQPRHHMKRTLNNLRSKKGGYMLDVGSGNGRKAILLAKHLERQKVNITIDSVEPRRLQREALGRSHKKEDYRFYRGVFVETLEKFGERFEKLSLRERERSKVYDIILLIHSLYEFPRDDSGNILSLNVVKNVLHKVGTAIIIVEHPDSDFQKMKRELYPKLGKGAPVSQDVVIESLKTVEMPYEIGRPITSRFPLGDALERSDVDVGMDWAFLFSDSLEEEPLSENDLSVIGRWVKGNARKDEKGRPYLWTPDSVIFAFRRRKQPRK